MTWLAHRCPNNPPGPASPPRRHRADDVIFVPGDFSAEFLRQELDEACLLLDVMRDKRHEVERSVSVAVEKAFRDIYNQTPIKPGAQDDVARLVVAARIVAHEDQRPEALRELDEAAEAFADRVPWDDEPEDAGAGG